MVPLALAAVWLGSPYLPVLVALGGAGMGWEWARLARVASPVAVLLIIAAPLVSACAMAVGQDMAAWLLALAFAAAIAIVEQNLRLRLWSAVATLWIALPCAAILWLGRGPAGWQNIFYLFAVVWASDIGAYAFGRVIGGPKLAPALSPNKTWAGAAGGLICAILVGVAVARLAAAPVARLIEVSFVVAIAAQLGDLAESFAKRRFHVKDSGGLIPGHGGLLDRLDSLLLGAVALALALAALNAGNAGP
jgi:phosphatidate cytidylyltransferase